MAGTKGQSAAESVAPPANGGGTIISTAVCCQLLMLSRQRLDQLVSEGFIHRHAPGQFKLVDTVQGYIRFLRDDARRQNKSAADSRVRDARAHEIEIRTAERIGKLVAIEDFTAMIDGLVGVVRSELGGLAARTTRDLPVRRAIDREINGTLRRIAKRADETAARLEAGRPIDEAITGDDAG